MTMASQQFPYVEMDPSFGAASALPYLPINLDYNGKNVSVSSLVDSGAALNVLPYDIGLQLGAVWEQQTIPVRLTGNLANVEARAIVVAGTVGTFSAVRLAFGWALTNDVPVILGQANFFMEFDVCFFRSRLIFEIRPKDSGKR